MVDDLTGLTYSQFSHAETKMHLSILLAKKQPRSTTLLTSKCIVKLVKPHLMRYPRATMCANTYKNPQCALCCSW